MPRPSWRPWGRSPRPPRRTPPTAIPAGTRTTTTGATWTSRIGGTPSVTSAQPGETIALNGLTVSAALPAWLAQYGYNFGLLQSGENEIPVTVWVGVRGDQHDRGRAGLRGRDDRVHDDHDLRRRSSSRRRRSPTTIPPLGATQWTARGGPVAFSQAGSGVAARTAGRSRRAHAEAARERLHPGLAGPGQARAGLRARARTSPRASERQEAAPEPFADVAVPVVLLPRRGAGGDERRAGERRTGPPPRTRPRRRGDAVRLRAVGLLPAAGGVSGRAARGRGCWSRATTRSAGR